MKNRDLANLLSRAAAVIVDPNSEDSADLKLLLEDLTAESDRIFVLSTAPVSDLETVAHTIYETERLTNAGTLAALKTALDGESIIVSRDLFRSITHLAEEAVEERIISDDPEDHECVPFFQVDVNKAYAALGQPERYELPVAVTLETKTGIEVIQRFTTIGEAEDFLATSATIDPDELAAGHYGIDAPEGMDEG